MRVYQFHHPGKDAGIIPGFSLRSRREVFYQQFELLLRDIIASWEELANINFSAIRVFIVENLWNNPESLNSLGMQTFFVTLCCRAQHCLHTGTIASKKVASVWAQQTLGEQYSDLIKEANEAWLGDRAVLFSTPSNADAVKLTMALVNDTTLALNNNQDKTGVKS